jgi:hypothetical protein
MRNLAPPGPVMPGGFLIRSHQTIVMKFRVKHIFRTFVITLLFSGLTLAVSAQKKNLTHQSLYFLCYYGSYHISPAWGVTLEVENRRFFHRSRDLNWILPRLGVVRYQGKGR